MDKPRPSFAPLYCAMYPELAEIAREHGYALAIHGSLQRDFDLIALPWSEMPSDPNDVIAAMGKKFALARVGDAPTVKNHGRLAYTLSISFGHCFLDLSFMPTINKHSSVNVQCKECRWAGHEEDVVQDIFLYCPKCGGSALKNAPAQPSRPGDATAGSERERRLASLLKEAVMHVGNLSLNRSASKWVEDAQAALAEAQGVKTDTPPNLVPVYPGPDLKRGDIVYTPSGRRAEVYNIDEDKGTFTSQGQFCASVLRREALSPGPWGGPEGEE